MGNPGLPEPLAVHLHRLFYVGTLKGVWRVYQQTVIDTYSKVGFAKLYTRKTPLTAADILNDRVIPFFDEHDIRVDRILKDRGTEYCGAQDRHEYELYLAVENIDHTRTNVKTLRGHSIGPADRRNLCHFARRPRMRLISPFLRYPVLFSGCPWVTAWQRAGREVRARLRGVRVAPPLRRPWAPSGLVASDLRSAADMPSLPAQPFASLHIAFGSDCRRTLFRAGHGVPVVRSAIPNRATSWHAAPAALTRNPRRAEVDARY